MPPQPSNAMRSLERAIDVLEVLDESRHALRLTDIARRAGLPVATTQRILNALEARGRVERDSTGYRPGVGLVFGAHAYLSSSPLVLAARPVLHDLAAETGLTSSVFRRVGMNRVVVARVDGSNPLRYQIPIGERLPLHLGAGKALCATMPSEELDELLDQLDRAGHVSGPAGRAAFTAELDDIRRRGYSTAFGERVPGMSSVAAAVPADGPATAVVQVSGISADIPVARTGDLGPEVRRAAYAISRSLA